MQADERREVQPEERERGADEKAIDQADEELAAEVGDHITVDLRKGGRDFVFQRRVAQGQIFPPAALDRGPFLEEEEGIDRHHDETEKKAGHAEEAADAGFDQEPELGDEIGQLFLDRGQLFFAPSPGCVADRRR